MVGVGGRSRACDNCRRRRVKCDLSTPQCQRCLKARLNCGGLREMTVIQYYGGRRGQTASPQSQSQAAEVESQDSAISSSASLTGNELLPFGNFRLSTDFDEVFVTYTRARLLGEGGAHDMIQAGLDGSLKGKSFTALSTVYFGIHHMDRFIIQRGFEKYGRALSQLNRALDDPKARQSSDTLEAMGNMGLFEFLTSDCEDGWVAHSRGVEQLLEIRGPESMMSLPSVSLLEKYRPTIIFAAIVSRRSTILSRRKWKGIPWLVHPERQDAMKCLVDIMADCSELLYLQETIRANMAENRRAELRKDLLNKAYQTLHNLQEWEGVHAPNSPIHSKEIPSPSTTPSMVDSNGQSQPLWSTVLHFNSLHHANVAALYCSTLVLVLRLILGLKLTMNDLADYETLDERLQSAGMAICRGVDYHMEAMEGGATVTLFLLFPLRMAFNAIGETDLRIGLWLKSILQRISSAPSGRWALTQYLLDIKASSRYPGIQDSTE